MRPSGNQDDRIGIDDLKDEGFGKEQFHSVGAELYLQLRGKLPVSGRTQRQGRRGYQIGTGFLRPLVHHGNEHRQRPLHRHQKRARAIGE